MVTIRVARDDALLPLAECRASPGWVLARFKRRKVENIVHKIGLVNDLLLTK